MSQSTLPTDAGSSDLTNDDDEPPEDCDCEHLNGRLPCWDCVRTGRKEIPEVPVR
ncbi:hypothetical protein [Halorubrum ezzemoulense]|uniref:hypothetical protein n=1 Tax=Halorubrum ezzemoulense TaxID=337243 RepID=UPI0015952ED4|nr:hypothetical protein [Halorubrum ezzemoulense]